MTASPDASSNRSSQPARYRRYFRFTNRTLLLATLVVAGLLAFPVRRYWNHHNFEAIKQNLIAWDKDLNSRPSLKTYKPIYYMGGQTAWKRDRDLFWLSFEIQHNRGLPIERNYDFDVNVELDAFPSLSAPRVWALETMTKKQMTLKQLNELLERELSIPPILE